MGRLTFLMEKRRDEWIFSARQALASVPARPIKPAFLLPAATDMMGNDATWIVSLPRACQIYHPAKSSSCLLPSCIYHHPSDVVPLPNSGRLIISCHGFSSSFNQLRVNIMTYCTINSIPSTGHSIIPGRHIRPSPSSLPSHSSPPAPSTR